MLGIIEQYEKLKAHRKEKFESYLDYINKGGLHTGWSPLELISETEKAIKVSALRYGSNAFLWLPKSQLQLVVNDYFPNDLRGKIYLAPLWLTIAKKNFGYEI